MHHNHHPAAGVQPIVMRLNKCDHAQAYDGVARRQAAWRQSARAAGRSREPGEQGEPKAASAHPSSPSSPGSPGLAGEPEPCAQECNMLNKVTRSELKGVQQC